MSRSRKEFPTSVRVDAWRRCDGKCERCGVALKRKAFDHINPDAMTGRNDLANCQVLCLPCHKEKTAQDIALIAQAKRREAKFVAGVRPRPRQKIPTHPKAERPPRDKLPLPRPRPLYQGMSQ